jgi:hypothetical protein
MAWCFWALEKEDVSKFLVQTQTQDAHSWLVAVMDHLPHEELTRVVVSLILWALWHAPRKAIHENIFQSSLSTHCFVDRYVVELEMTEPKPVTGDMPAWLPPPMGVSKINVDAALYIEELKYCSRGCGSP